MGAFGTVLAGLGVLLGLLLLLLAVPVAAEFRLQRVEAFEGQVRVRWLFGLVRLRHRWPEHGAAAAAPDAHGREPPRDRQSVRTRHGSRVDALRVLRDAAFRRRVARLARDLVEALHLRQLHLRARLGLGDPADTGRLWALLGPLNAAAQTLARIDVRIEPEFLDPVLEFDARGACRLVPLRLLTLALAFVLSPVTLRAWRNARAGNA